MRAALSDEQRALRAMARAVAAEGGDAEKVWRRLEETGLLDLRADGAGTLELALCAEAFAAELSTAPFIGATLARELGVGGRAVAALDGDLAPDAFGAELVVVDGGALPALPATTADRSRVAARAGSGGVDERITALALVLLAADLVGVGTAALDDALEHVRHRHQFGVPVGSFQAVQHLAADAHVGLVAARNLVWAAAWRGDLTSARRAKAVASEAGRGACEVACQLLGGIGHTWEHRASVRLRRALVSRHLLGDESAQYAALAGTPPARTPAGLADDGYDLRDDATEAAFRAELGAWLEAHPDHADWHRSLAAGGWVGVSMPLDAGGRGLPVTCEAIVSEELGAADAPPPPAVGHLAHALATFGTPEQRARQLGDLLSGTTKWCQGFSEPEAGSDLASVRTKAEQRDGRWVVNGRKIWTSDAAVSDWCLLLCRTGEAGHRGLSVLLVPLDTPGIEVSPIVTAWGSEEFAEVTFDEVEVPVANLLGNPGQGWEIAMALLAVERGPADIGWIARFRRTATSLVTTGRPEATRAVAWLEALDATVAATLTARVAGTHDPSAGSVDKLLMTFVDQQLHSAALDAAGLPTDGEALERYLWSRAAGTFGGTSQVQRDIVAQRLLGLPRRAAKPPSA
ncbi:MAG: acyl-CoA dehydrogenase [Acidimicrobiales bacterium]|nr:acyl-CoA dehydrogenase [Acidimicrobiales bacterium]